LLVGNCDPITRLGSTVAVLSKWLAFATNFAEIRYLLQAPLAQLTKQTQELSRY
jgi:hypothetical protein